MSEWAPAPVQKGVVKLGHVSLERKYRRKGHICRGVIPGSACIWPCLRF